MTKFRMRLATAVVAIAGISATPAGAALTFNVVQAGANVQVNGAGTFVIDPSTLVRDYSSAPQLRATDSLVTVGPSGVGNVLGYSGLTGPRNLGSGALVLADSGTGDAMGFNIFPVFDPAGVARVLLPVNYVSGAPLAGTATFLNQTIASLGLIEGQYLFSTTTDTITVNIGDVPEPATWASMILGFGLAGAALRRRRGTARRRPA